MRKPKEAKKDLAATYVKRHLAHKMKLWLMRRLTFAHFLQNLSADLDQKVLMKMESVITNTLECAFISRLEVAKREIIVTSTTHLRALRQEIHIREVTNQGLT